MLRYCEDVADNRAVSALKAVLPAGARVQVAERLDRDTVVELAGRRLRIRWIPIGWPRQVREALSYEPMPDVVAAPLLSPGARHLAGQFGAGWLDESGAAEISHGLLLISRSGTAPPRTAGDPEWRPATLAVCEALLTGCLATATAVTGRTGLAASTVVGALKFLDHSGFLSASAARGRLSGRYVSDAEGLLDAYASAAGRLRSATALRVGAIWRDPLLGAVSSGERWGGSGIPWAVTKLARSRPTFWRRCLPSLRRWSFTLAAARSAICGNLPK